MYLRAFRDSLLASTIVAGAVIASPAFAQVEPNQGATPTAPVAGGSSTSASPDNSNGTDASGNTGNTGEIVVTGSRLSNPSLTSSSPLAVVSSQEFKLQGNTRVEDTLNQLPQVTVGSSSTDVNGATGIATVNLRNLGSIRTLVLVNGRRLVPGDPTNPVSDINFIPGSLIQRVDVLTGGASSVYGSDAVAGVVNFVMNKDFEGFQVDAQTSVYQHDNDITQGIRNALAGQNGTTRAFGGPEGNTVGGFQRTVSLTAGVGTEDGRGHITAYATFRKVNAVSQADRDFSNCSLIDGSYGQALGLPYNAGTAYCSGSSTTDVGRFRRTTGTAPVYGGTGPSFTNNPNAPGSFRTYSGPRDSFNFNPYNYFQRPDERYTAGAFAHYQVSDAFDPYIEFMFMDDRTKAQIAPSGAFYGTDFFINCNNPLLSAAQATSLCGANAGTGAIQSLYIGRRNVEGGGRVDDLRHTAYRIVAGAKGDIAKGISYDAYGQIGRTLLTERYSNDFSRSRLNRALNVVRGPNGQIVCASAIPNAQGQVVDANCVPYNIFTGTTTIQPTIGQGVTQGALNYLQTPGSQTGNTTEYVANASVTIQGSEYGLQSPFANSGLGINFGGEYRRESLELNRDVEFLTGDLAGQGTPFGTPDASGFFDVKEAFVEAQLPLVEDKPFFQELSLGASYRYSHYSIQGNTNTYKFDAQWSPVKGVRFRGAYNRAVRAPNILELFTPAYVGLFAGTDPCASAEPSATLAQCALTGVTAAQYGAIDENPSGQYNQRISGNSSVRPEVADTYTAGVVINPTFARSFVLSVDAYQIKVKKTISTIGAQNILNSCINTANPTFCSAIQRSADGSLWTGAAFVDNPTLNLGSLRTRGIDVAASYKLQLERFGMDRFGSIGFDLQGTYLDEYRVEPVSGAQSVGRYNCAGYYGLTCGVPQAKWRSNLRLTWNLPNNLQLSGRWRFIGRVKNDVTSSNVLLSSPSLIDPLSNHIKAVSYFDTTISARIEDKYTVRLGVQNLLDRTPPISYAYASNGSNTYAGSYDALGRYIFAGVTVDF